MKLPRFAAAALGVVIALACTSAVWAGQSAPKLDRSQRAVLEAVVAAVDQTANGTAAAHAATWHVHVMRASDGSHYVALRAEAPGVPSPRGLVTLYVRLASGRRGSDLGQAPERSAVMEWLKGLRADPLPMRASSGMTVPQGEMPFGGTAAAVGDIAADATSALRLMAMQRQRDVKQREEREAKRKAELGSSAAARTSPMLAFEDFTVSARLGARGDGTQVLRNLTAAPGDYDVYVAWAEPPSPKQAPVVHVLTRHLTLPAASSTTFSLSDIVVADAVTRLDAPYPVAQQNEHPYAMGALEAVPARNDVFRVDESLSVLFQVINPSLAATGKPNVAVEFRVTRLLDGREDAVGSLPTQHYDASNLPVDFDVAKGHPLFVAVQAPLAKFTRGRYRMAITALDNVWGLRASSAVTFNVSGTADSLLREAPTPGQAFTREAILTPERLAMLARTLSTAAPSEGLARALEAAAAGRFADVLRDDRALASERPVAQALRGLALYGLGDTPRSVASQLQQALAQGAPTAPVELVLGATFALSGDDKAAIAAWNLARDGGVDDASVAMLLADAYMRQGDMARAAAVARAALDSRPNDESAARGLAATYIAAGRFADALALLDARHGAEADPDSEFLVLHALYAGFATGQPPGATPAGRTRFSALAGHHVASSGRHAALVKEWLALVDDPASRRP